MFSPIFFQMDEAFAERVRCSIQDLMTRLQGGIRQTIKEDDYSIYTGQTGEKTL